jgi:phosphoglycolate phosphatase-like HAD superfamily hydrolase
MPIDYTGVDALTFDCYGTLIDWEAGLTEAFRPVLDAHGVDWDVEDVLTRYARYEAAAEAGRYVTYREVLAAGLRGAAHELGFEPTADEVAAFSGSVGDWPAFPDSAAALARLKRRFRLGVITNCDDAPPAGRRLRLDRHGPAGRLVQARRGELPVRVRPARPAARTDRPRRPEPVPRPRAGQAARSDHRVDRPSP